MNHRRRESLAAMPDQRFQQGTTTGNAYKQPEPEVFKRKVLFLTQVLCIKTLGKIHAIFYHYLPFFVTRMVLNFWPFGYIEIFRANCG